MSRTGPRGCVFRVGGNSFYAPCSRCRVGLAQAREWEPTLPPLVREQTAISDQAAAAEHNELRISEQRDARRQKREWLLDAGQQAYPVCVARDRTLAEIRAAHGELPAGSASGEMVATAGRVMSQRDIGGILFATLRAGDGAELQVMLTSARSGGDLMAGWRQVIDIGDIVAVHGEVVTTSRGELTVVADKWEMAAKALRPLPTPRSPLSDEFRVRRRYVDLIVRPEAGAMVRTRSAVLRSLRESFYGPCSARGSTAQTGS
jgi:lysyl-tRNA synthetase class 2